MGQAPPAKAGYNLKFMVSHHVILHHSRRALLWGSGLFAVVFLLLWLGLQTLMLNHVDRYRPDLVTALSRATGTRIEIGSMESGGIHWLPTVVLNHITVFDPQGKPGLVLDRVEGRVSILGFFQGRADLNTLIIDQPDLTLSRSSDGQLFLSGIPLPRPDGGASQFMEWLAHQGDIRVTHATMHWRDDVLKAPPLLLSHGAIRIRNNGSRHRLEASFDPPEKLSRQVTLKADFYGDDLQALQSWRGNVQVQSAGVDLAMLRQWIQEVDPVHSARGKLKLDFALNHPGEWSIDAELDMKDIVAQLAENLAPLHFEHLQGGLSYKTSAGGLDFATQKLVVTMPGGFKTAFPLDLHLALDRAGGSIEINQLELNHVGALLDSLPLSEEQRNQWRTAGFKGKISRFNLGWKGSQTHPDEYYVHSDFSGFQANPQGFLPAIRGFEGHLDATSDGGALKGKGSETFLNFPKIFVGQIPVQSYSLESSWSFRKDRTEVLINRFEVENADLAGHVSGKLTFGAEGPGQSDLSGELQRLNPSAVWRYLPLGVSADARNWLQSSLKGGNAQQVTFESRGDLQQFPFQGDQGGRFRFSAQISDGGLRYDPVWPAITGIRANLQIRGGELLIDASDGLILGSRIRQAHADIPDMTRSDAQLAVSGKMEGDVHDGLAFISQSPVAGYIHHFTDGVTGAGSGHLALSLQIPLQHAKDTRVQGDYQFLGATLDDGDAGIPPLTQVQGHLLFNENSLTGQGLASTVLGGAATFELATLPSGAIRIVGRGRAEMGGLREVYHHAVLQDVTGTEAWQGEFMFSRARTDIRLDTRLNYLGEPVQIQASTLKDGTFDIAMKGRTSRESLLKRYATPLLKALDSPVDWTGHLDFKSGRDEVNILGTTQMFQEPAKLTIKGSSRGKLLAEAFGKVPVEGLRRLGYGALVEQAKGAAEWKARVEQDGPHIQLVVSSTLTGVAISLPEPFQKPAQEALPLNLTWSAEGNDLQFNGVLGNWVGVLVQYVVQPKGGSWQVRRGVVNLGGMAKAMTGEGFGVSGTLAHANLDQWRPYLASHSGEAADSGYFGKVTWINLGLNGFVWGGRNWGDHRLTAIQEGDHWSAQIRGAEADGELTWIPEGTGRIRAHMTRLTVPAAPPGKPVEHAVDPDEEKNMPSLDLVAERFSARGNPQGRLQLTGVREGPLWRLERFSLVSQQAVLEGDGRWTSSPAPQTQLNLHLKATNLGNFMSDVGYPNMVARGTGEVRGQASWNGNPEDFKVGGVSGQFSLDLHDGQFSKVEPGGAGRLIGLLSLQTLPRRITLDFHDIFSDGFAFDSLTANVVMKQGVVSTRDFDMVGPAARINLLGTLDVLSETTDMTVRVAPAVGGSVSLATTVIGGPIAGAASYVLQKLLKNPIDKVLTYEYTIEGGWDEPQIKPLRSPTAADGQPRGF